MSEYRTYECAHCHGVFESEWTDEEAAAEAEELWGDQLVDPVIVCDDCFQAMQRIDPIADYLARLNEARS